MTQKTIQQLAQEAYDVQNACNLAGVLHSFARAYSDLRSLLEGKSSDEVAQHPIMQLWSDKVAHLTSTQYGDVTGAYGWVLDTIKGETPDVS